MTSELGERGCTRWRRPKLGELAHAMVVMQDTKEYIFASRERGEGPPGSSLSPPQEPLVRCWGRLPEPGGSESPAPTAAFCVFLFGRGTFLYP